MEKMKWIKKGISALLALNMVLSSIPLPAFAATTDNLCDHHPVHTDECGYVEAAEGSPCTHIHDEACGYAEPIGEVLCACTETDDTGALVHTEGCGYVAPVAGSDCTHAHDEVCGYAEAVEAHECHYECAECANNELSSRTSPQTGVAIPEGDAQNQEIATSAPDGDLLAMTEKICDCGTDDPAIHATTCAVYVAPENPVCSCAEACGVETQNFWCDVCGFDYAKCTGTDTAVVYADEDCTYDEATNTYTVYTADGLFAAAELVNGGAYSANITLAADIVLNENLADKVTVAEDGTVSADDSVKKWTPMGENSLGVYKGTFDGGNHTITGLYCVSTGYDNTGLISTLAEGATVKNVKIHDFCLESSGGAVVGYNWGEVIGCSISGTGILGWTTGYQCVGGVVGYNDGTVKDCTSSAALTFRGMGYFGGIVGQNMISQATIIGCSNSGTITAAGYSEMNVGGILDGDMGTVKDCYNTGSIRATVEDGSVQVGGIAGVSNTTVSGCYNTAAVSGDATGDYSSAYVGGIVGLMQGTVSGCYNTGIVSGDATGDSSCAYVGGITSTNGGTVSDCYNTAAVSGDATGESAEASVGGIAGVSSATVSGCYNIGSIDSGTYSGSIAAYAYGTYADCFYLDGCVKSGNIEFSSSEGITAMSADQFASGEVAYLLNGDQSTITYRQTLGSDAYPSFTGGTVYRVENCKEEPVYSNTNENIGHQWVNGTCTVCGEDCAHTGGTATCTTPAVCEACGASYGERKPHSFNDSGFCTVCNTATQAKLVAKSDGTVTYFATLPEALAAEHNAWDKVYALADYEGDITVPAGLCFYGENHTFSGDVSVWGGRIFSGTFNGEVQVYPFDTGEVTALGFIYGGTFRNAVFVGYECAVYGGTFEAELELGGSDVFNFAGDEYHITLGENFALKLDGDTTINCQEHFEPLSFDCTVGKLCRLCREALTAPQAHTGGTTKPTDNGNGTHSFTCTVCGNVTEDHTFDENGTCVCGVNLFDDSDSTLTIDGTLGGKTEATEEDITVLVNKIQDCVDSGITTIIVTGSNPAMIDMVSWINTAIGEAIYRLRVDESYHGKIDLILQDVTEIVDQEFDGAHALNSITLPKVTTVGNGAFYDCQYLKELTFGSVVTAINHNNRAEFHRVGEKVDGCDLVLNCGQLQAEYTLIPDLENNVWWTGDTTWKSITLTHSYGDWVSNGDGTHKRTCANDSTHIENGDCSGGTATCTTLAVCDTCGKEYGELAAHTPDADGECTVDGCGYQYAAKVGDSFYETIYKALRAAEEINGCTLTLLDDVTLTSMSSYASYVNTGMFALDLNGKTLSSNKRTLEVMGSADLTIRDSIGGGKIVSTGGSAVYLSGGKLTIESGTFEGTLDGVFLSYDSTLIVKGGTFTGSRAMITGSGSNVEIDLTAIDPSGLTLKNNGGGTFAPKLPDGYGMVDSDGKLLSSLSAEQSATVHKHEYKYTDLGDGNHQQACSCGMTTGEPAAHSTTAEDDKAATCIAPAYCSVCDSEYGAVDTTNHDSSVECVNGFCPNGCYEPATLNAEGFYEIFNAGQLYWFAQRVNIAADTAANGKLMADIDLENRTWYPIGLYDDIAEANGSLVQKQYAGTFDGNNHTVSNFTATGNGSQGLFGYCNYSSAQIKNLGVINATVSGWNAGAVAGYCANLTNCYAVGCTITGASDTNTQAVTISSVGGNNGATVITNCWAYNCKLIVGEGEASYVMQPVGGIRASNDSVNIVQNCYYGEIVTVATFTSTTGATEKTEAQFASGEVAYLLGSPFGQTIGTHSLPVLYGETVYYGYTSCADNAVIGYTNDPNASAEKPDHSTTAANDKAANCGSKAYCSVCESYYGEVDKTNHDETVAYENGFCPNGCYEPATLNAAGYYEIDNAGKLFWFAQQVNVEGNREIKGVLTADIDLENKPWTPIGETGENNNNFRGVFDGQNYIIRGLNVEGSENGVGFFGEVRTGTVKNFTIYGEVVVNTEVNYVGGVIGSICGVNGETSIEERNGAVIQNITSFVNVTAKVHGIGMIGGFVGYANHQSLIEKCAWYGTFDAGIYRVDSGAGGFIGKIQENTSEVTIRNCGAYGTIKTNYAGDYNNTATIYMGGFLSFSNTGAQTVLENCLFAGRFERGENLTDEARLGAFGTLRSVKAIKNCYYLGDDGLAAVHSDSDLKPGSDNVEITSVTGEDLRGEMRVVWHMLGEYWTQGIHYPILKEGRTWHGDSATYTYTDNGDGTHKKTCNECGYVEEVNEEHYVDPTTTYTDNGNGTHSFKCAKCDAVMDSEPHTIENHVCTACGAMEIVVSFDAGDYEWKTGDQIRLLRWKNDQHVNFFLTAEVTEDGTVTWTPDKTLCWNGTDKHTLVASCPNMNLLFQNFQIPEDQSDLQKLKKADCMNAMWSGNPTTDPITFNLKHRLAKVTVNYEVAEGVTVSKAEVYTLTQYMFFDVYTLERKDVAWEEGHDLWINSYLDGNRFTAFVSPDAYAADGNFIKITLSDGSVREVKMNKAVTFEEGAEYTYTVVITADGAYLTCADECSFEYTDNGDGTHDKVCSKCGYVAASEAHSGGTATCTEQAECQHCGASYGEVDITNHDETAEYVNGFCPNCDAFEPATDSDSNGYYDIDNAGKLYWFAAQVNSGNTNINGELKANIVINEDVLAEMIRINPDPSRFRLWTPIGTEDNAYIGDFCGLEHTVSGLYFNDSNAGYVGLFGYVASGMVNHLGVIDSYFNGSGAVGGVVGHNEGTVEYAYSNSYVGGNVCIGGVVGDNRGTVMYAYNLGSISGLSEVGGVTGTNYNNVKNCYNVVSISGDFLFGDVVGDNFGTLENCYYPADAETDELDGTTAKTWAQFKSGEVAYLLGRPFGQNIGTNSVPVLYGETVYAVHNCKNEVTYSNTNENLGHNYVNGVCTVCGAILCDHSGNENQHTDCTKDFVCSVCGAVITEARAEHTHGTPAYSWTEDPITLTVTVSCTACGETFTGSTTDMKVTTSDDGFTTTYTASVTLNGKEYTDRKIVSNEVTRVNITWGEMDFTYTDESGWNTPDTAWVQVENTGNTAVSVTYDYVTERTDITGSFFDGTSTVTAPVAIDAAGTKKIWLRLDGKPGEALNNTKIGSVKLTIE